MKIKIQEKKRGNIGVTSGVKRLKASLWKMFAEGEEGDVESLGNI